MLFHFAKAIYLCWRKKFTLILSVEKYITTFSIRTHAFRAIHVTEQHFSRTGSKNKISFSAIRNPFPKSFCSIRFFFFYRDRLPAIWGRGRGRKLFPILHFLFFRIGFCSVIPTAKNVMLERTECTSRWNWNCCCVVYYIKPEIHITKCAFYYFLQRRHLRF